jgi:hypothetical protein
MATFRLPLRGGAWMLESRRGGGCKTCDDCEDVAERSEMLFAVFWSGASDRAGSVGRDRAKLGSSPLACSSFTFLGEVEGLAFEAVSLPMAWARLFASAINRATPLAPASSAPSPCLPGRGESMVPCVSLCGRIAVVCPTFSSTVLSVGITLLEPDCMEGGALGLVGRPGRAGGVLRNGEPAIVVGEVAVRFCMELLSGLIV